MRKKFRIWLQKVLDFRSYNNTSLVPEEIEKAKSVYIANNASIMTMKRNGEYEGYQKFNISVDTEINWSREVIEVLMSDILKTKKLYKVVALSNVNLPHGEIIEAFRTLAESPLKKEIYAEIVKQEKLIEEIIYPHILACFS